MRPLLQALTLLTAIGALTACDDVTPGAAGGELPTGPVSDLDQSAPREQDIPPIDPVRAAPSDLAQAAPREMDQAPPRDPNASSGGSSSAGAGSCSAMCNKSATMGCASSIDCAAFCTLVDSSAGCQSQASTLMACAAAAQDCDSFEACDGEFEAFVDCAIGGNTDSGNDTNDSSSGNSSRFTIQSSSCTTASYCQSCSVGSCDQCVCAAQLAQASSDLLTATCGSTCN